MFLRLVQSSVTKIPVLCNEHVIVGTQDKTAKPEVLCYRMGVFCHFKYRYIKFLASFSYYS